MKLTPTEKLRTHLPEKSISYCIWLYEKYNFQLKIKNRRLTKLGDYKFDPRTKRHAISINNDLNPYAFLITYLHEVAHLITFEQHKRKVRPHGKEWKAHFKQLALPMLSHEVFPDGVLRRLARYLKNPKASSCNDHELMKVLSDHNEVPSLFLTDVPFGEIFSFGKRRFKKEGLRRTRYVCQDVQTGRRYLISKSAEVVV